MDWARLRLTADPRCIATPCGGLRFLARSSSPIARYALWFGLILLAAGWPGAEAVAQTPARVAVMQLNGAIGPANSSYIQRSFARARHEEVDLIVLQIDTPGGLVDAMRKIIQEILASPIPVVGFVAPSGAHAASAGTYILYACHVAAMAPGTNLGAATPIQVDWTGQIDGDAPDTAKVVNDAAAYIRSLAELRRRNADWAERAVREAASLPAGDALRLKVVDLLADNTPQLLAKLEGRTIEAGGLPHRLGLANHRIVDLGPGWRTELLGLLASPTIAYGLLLLAIFGIMTELLVPGVIAPGVLGAISLMVALYAFQIIPVNFAGFGLILLGVGLMALELMVPGFGVFGLGGVVSFVIGSVLLMDTGVPGFDMPTEVIAGMAILSSGLLMQLMLMMRRVRIRPKASGSEGMVGSEGEVLAWTGGRGRIRLRGTSWTGEGPPDLTPGERVRVVAVKGLTLAVEPYEEEPRA